MNCDKVRHELVAYVRGEMEEEPRKAVEEHLVRCGDCTKEWESTRDVLGIMRLDEAASIKELATRIIRTALIERASDIHLEQHAGVPRFRLRIDGLLREPPDVKVAAEQYEPLILRLKYMAEMHLSERVLPQDGRFFINHQGKDLQLRVNVFPYFGGEGAVMRIVDPKKIVLGLDRLGFLPDMLARIEALLAQPNGLILAAGPTGAGKTTTLYSMLQRLNSPEKKLLTIEDPVEYQMAGLNQASVYRRAGRNFAYCLRVFMHQDPDVVMVGEIRDLETLEMTIQATLTGHLMLSVVHTRDATSAVARLLDVGVAPFLLSASLIGILGQRLIRKTCPDCRAPYEPDDGLPRLLGYTPETRPERFTRGAGCASCQQTGYLGRTGLFELLTFNRELGELIDQGATEPALRARALELGLLWPFDADARAKVAEGITTVEEVARVLPGLAASGAE